MEDVINRLLEFGMGGVIDKSRDSLLFQDKKYEEYSKELVEAEKYYKELTITEQQRKVIDDYITCTNAMMCRVNDISYFAGVRDALAFLNQTGLKENAKI